MTLLEYGRAKSAFDGAKGDSSKLKGWEGHPMMTRVEHNTFEIHKERLVHRRDHAAPVPTCRFCRKEYNQ